MLPFRLLKTSVFSLTLIYMIIYGGFALVGVVFFYVYTVSFIAQQTDQTIGAEVLGLAEAYQTLGPREGVRSIVERRSQDPGDSLYSLVKDDLSYVAGNLTQWPDLDKVEDGWVTFQYERNLSTVNGSETRHARGRITQMKGSGERLLVARDIEDRRKIEERLTSILFISGGLIILVGFGGGLVLTKSLISRIDLINRTSRQIMAGNLNRRVPLAGKNDEIDQLANNLNAMLDRIEQLMLGMKEVTDNVAHDLRSPLTRLRNRLEVTMLTSATEDDYHIALEAGIKDADNLLKTFNALLSIASVESGARRESMTRVCAADVVRDVAELYEPVAEEKNVDFALHVDGEGAVWGNRELLSQAMANLMDNAIKYTPEGGAVHVDFHAPPSAGGMAEFTVSDTGPGIPEADRERVFNRFVRLEASRSQPGSGLGLSLVAAVARLHDGRLELGESAMPNVERANASGLRATLRLPMIA